MDLKKTFERELIKKDLDATTRDIDQMVSEIETRLERIRALQTGVRNLAKLLTTD